VLPVAAEHCSDGASTNSGVILDDSGKLWNSCFNVSVDSFEFEVGVWLALGVCTTTTALVRVGTYCGSNDLCHSSIYGSAHGKFGKGNQEVYLSKEGTWEN
jgi:hypothetical protein